MRLSLLALLASTAPLAAEVPQVVTDIPVIGAITASVMGDLGQPEILLAAGADEHHYQLRPSQAAALEQAQLVVMISPSLTPWLDTAAHHESALVLLESRGTITRAYAEPEPDHDHEHEEEHGAEHEGHSHEGADPHAWLDPRNGALWAGTIAERLAALDPENALTYRANAKAYAARLTALDAELAATLAPVQAKPFLVGHDAFGYLQERYGLNILGAVTLGDATAGGAAHVQALSEQAKTAACIFPEAQQSAKPVDQLAQDGPKIGRPLDPSGATMAYDATLYERLLREIGTSLTECLGA